MAGLFYLLPPSAYLAPPSSDTQEEQFDKLVPFEMFVILAGLPGLQGDKEKSVELYGKILRGCKMEMRRCDDETEKLRWRTRAQHVGKVMAETLVQLGVRSASVDGSELTRWW